MVEVSHPGQVRFARPPLPEGTLVCLKTGGPLMTVEQVRHDRIVATVWMVDGVVHRDGFAREHLNVLKIVEDGNG